MIASKMRKSFQNGSGDERVGLSSSASGIDAFSTRLMTISYFVMKFLFCDLVSFDHVVRRNGGGSVFKFVRNCIASCQDVVVMSIDEGKQFFISSKFVSVRIHRGCLDFTCLVKFPSLK